MVPFTHFPGTAWKFSTRAFMARSPPQYFTMASASGCSDFFSREAAIERISDSEWFPRLIILVTFGRPSVKVPVLSNTMALILQAISSGSPHLMRIPFWAHFPVPTIMAVGVASPSAHGQAMTITAAK